MQSIQHPWCTALTLALSAILLSACGGGGSETTVTVNGQPSNLRPCSLPAGTVLELVYDVGSQSYGRDAVITLPLGQAVLATPRLKGLPSECSNSVIWDFSVSGTSTVSKLEVSKSSGVVSGTAARTDWLEIQARWTMMTGGQTGGGLFRFIGG
ncbi:hypothetical protein RQP53_14920 [Paucibacter sp. APW11]|uniref:Uncharacterized protein n=1 Tax=Roseateles aquae TaxID=3077235 RepID=A0ABU3PDB1_9BURK|nr:hypothetical protein [Paucibacter sp. APW11]MDT9000564.1 hypothetical protein [Paucibacter sp. APW11]